MKQIARFSYYELKQKTRRIEMIDRRAGGNRLDSIRKRQGNSPCREYFKFLPEPASLELINDPELSFATFFILLPLVREKIPDENLSVRDRTAANLCGIIQNSKKANGDFLRPAYNESTHEALRWIFTTGADDDGLGEDFDHLLDIAAGILEKKYHDADILPKLVRMIFRRGKKGAYLHDLVWALYQSRDPKGLELAAEHLKSPNENEAELAQTLLHLKPQSNTPKARRKLYGSYLHWLEENSPYLYFTGENFNESSTPNACSVDLGAKYLYRKISHGTRRLATPLTEFEQNCLTCFANAPDEEKEFLAQFSQKMRAKDPAYWNRWIRYPLQRQIETAHHGGEGHI